MAAFGEIKEQVELAPADIRVLIGVSPAHTEFVKDLQGVIRAKGEIFLNGKNHILPYELYKNYYQDLQGNVLTFGYTPKSDIEITNAEILSNGTQVTLKFHFAPYQGQEITTIFPQHNLNIGENISASLLVIHMLGLNPLKAAKYIPEFKHPRPGRGDILKVSFKKHPITIIDQSYNANPQSMKTALESFARIPAPKDSVKIAVLGKMAELGDLEEQEHKKIFNLATKLGVDYIVFFGSPIYKKLLEHTKAEKAYYAEDITHATKIVEQIIGTLPKGTQVFILAKASNSQRAWELWKEWLG